MVPVGRWHDTGIMRVGGGDSEWLWLWSVEEDGSRWEAVAEAGVAVAVGRAWWGDVDDWLLAVGGVICWCFYFFECCVACVLGLFDVLGRVGPAAWGWP